MDAVVFDPMDYARSHTEPGGKNVRHPALPGGRGQVSIKTRRYPTPASRTQKINSGEWSHSATGSRGPTTGVSIVQRSTRCLAVWELRG
jgi:hypothetical protein